MPGSLPASDCPFDRFPGRCTSLQGHWGLAGEARPTLTVFGSPWWCRAGPITVRSAVISTAPSGCTHEELRGGGQKRTVAWDSKHGRGIEDVLLIKMLEKYLQ